MTRARFQSTSATMRHFYSDEFCTDSKKARSQEQLQDIANKIRANCKVEEIINTNDYTCTILINESLGLKYWINDSFGHISTIDEARYF